MGIPVGTGGNVFENVEDLVMSEELISTFDHIHNGLDWGFSNDPNAFNKMHFDATRQDLYIFAEHTKKKESNRDLFDALYVDTTHLTQKRWVLDEDEKGNIVGEHAIYEPKPMMDLNELLTADSAEPKSIADMKSYGCFIRPAEKGPDSVRYGIKWLQSLRHIYIDKRRCPDTYDEFVRYEYDRDKTGKIVSGFPDRDNHHIDATRYALERYYKHKGN